VPSLALDTATPTPVVALLDDDGAFLRGTEVDGRAQALLAAIDTLLQDVERRSIEHVVVGIGPGGFTGLRVGVATARGLAETLGVPLFGVNSLLVASGGDADATAVLPAGRGEWFVQRDGATAIEPAGDPSELTLPTPQSLARAAAQRIAEAVAAGEQGDPLRVLPSYGREPDATPPRMEVGYDELTARDLDAILQLEERCFPNPWTRGMYASELARPTEDSVQLAARDRGANDRLVGAALAARIAGAWHVMNVLVDPIARQRGIATTLMEQLIERTAELGAGEGWTLEVRDGNDPAIHLYERFGFVNQGRRPGYYQDTGDDALVMWRYAMEEAAR
jgi:ribosomal-protein-alanine N-acetyltransferase